MGVIKKPSVFTSDSEESLHIPQSDDESIYSEVSFEPIHTSSVNNQRCRFQMILPSFRRSRQYCGKRRHRQFENLSVLTTLVENEELNDIDISDFIANSKSQFTRLFENKQSLDLWYEFIESDEELQYNILHDADVKQKHKDVNYSSAFLSIDRHIRQKLKTRIPLGYLECVEKKLIDFFNISPSETFISEEVSALERLLIHAVSQYNHLSSKTFECPNGKGRLVRVINPTDTFKPVPERLSEYLNKRRTGLNKIPL